jgi:lactonase
MTFRKGFKILMPGRDEGKMLRSTHPQFIPGTNQLLICTNDIEMATPNPSLGG